MKKISAIFLALALLFTVTAVACAEGPQTFTASSPGFGGDVEVTVTVDGGQITDVRITGDKETSGIGAVAVAELPTRILEAQSAEFDAWTGASFTSAAVKAALTEALAQASLTANQVESGNANVLELQGAGGEGTPDTD